MERRARKVKQKNINWKLHLTGDFPSGSLPTHSNLFWKFSLFVHLKLCSFWKHLHEGGKRHSLCIHKRQTIGAREGERKNNIKRSKIEIARTKNSKQQKKSRPDSGLRGHRSRFFFYFRCHHFDGFPSGIRVNKTHRDKIFRFFFHILKFSFPTRRGEENSVLSLANAVHVYRWWNEMTTKTNPLRARPNTVSNFNVAAESLLYSLSHQTNESCAGFPSDALNGFPSRARVVFRICSRIFPIRMA